MPRLHPKHFRKRYRQYKERPLVRNKKRPLRRIRLPFLPRPNILRAILRLVFFAAAIFITFWLVYLAVFSSSFLINEIIVISDGKKIEDQNLTKPLQELLGENLIFVKLHDFEQNLRIANQDKFQKLVIDREFPDTIRITYSEFPSIANIIAVENNIQKKFQINKNGLLIKEDTENSDLPFIRIVEDKEYALGNKAISEIHLKRMIEAENHFVDKFGMPVVDVLYFPTEREGHLRTEREFKIWLDLEQDTLRQINKLKQALPKLDIYSLEIEYIDLRISGTNEGGAKVIYKKK